MRKIKFSNSFVTFVRSCSLFCKLFSKCHLHTIANFVELCAHGLLVQVVMSADGLDKLELSFFIALSLNGTNGFIGLFHRLLVTQANVSAAELKQVSPQKVSNKIMKLLLLFQNIDAVVFSVPCTRKNTQSTNILQKSEIRATIILHRILLQLML